MVFFTRMLQFQCPKCQHRLKAPRKVAGRSAKCNKCGTRIRIPTPPAKSNRQIDRSSESSGKQQANRQPHAPKKVTKTSAGKRTNPQQKIFDEIASQLDGKVPRSPLNLPYRFSLLLVAMIVVLMPLLYVCLIGTAGYGMYWYWTEVLPGAWKSLPGGRAAILAILLYSAPIVAGLIMIVFMIKPLFFSLVQPPEPRRRTLKRAGEPALFELVDQICEATRSPVPKRIDIDNSVNASAALRRGFLSLFGRDLVLTIGAPLIAGMNTRQLAGILGHEFGHFSQGSGMKTTFVIRRINGWFARVVYQRDQLDQMLDDGIAETDFRISIILLFGKLFVVISRGILWCFLIATHTISCMMTRQLEYDADRYEAYIAGSDYFENTSQRLMDLMAGQQAMISSVVAALDHETLLDDLPGIASSHADAVTRSERKQMKKLSEKGTQGFFSTHPPDDKRIKAAKAYRAEGLFRLEVPARTLFKNYDAICTGVSVDFYRNELGVFVDPNVLVRLDP